jgi:hypothetical protein
MARAADRCLFRVLRMIAGVVFWASGDAAVASRCCGVFAFRKCLVCGAAGRGWVCGRVLLVPWVSHISVWVPGLSWLPARG